MENMQTPYSKKELSSKRIKGNLEFIKELEMRVHTQGVFNHPLLVNMAEGQYSPEYIKFFFSQFSKHIRVFTAALSALLCNTPDIKSRFVLFDNLYEEMGRGQYDQCHFKLYISMLESLEIEEESLHPLPPLYSIELLNDNLFQAVTQKPFIAGLAWLGLGGELTIPNNFPFMVKALKHAFDEQNINWDFFDRHGGRDQMHSDDANIVLAMYMQPVDRELIEMEVVKSLAARKAVWDELEVYAQRDLKLHGASKVA